MRKRNASRGRVLGYMRLRVLSNAALAWNTTKYDEVLVGLGAALTASAG